MKNFLHHAVIIGTLPNTLTNGTTADATQVMADLNKIVNDVNANAAPLTNTALLNAANSFTAVQSGIAATGVANFPIASQVQNWAFNTLTSTLGTNTITARVASLALGAYAAGQTFTFVPSQPNTGAVTVAIDGLAARNLFALGSALVGAELRIGVPVQVVDDGSRLNIISPLKVGTVLSNYLAGDVALNNTANYFTGPIVSQGTVGTWLVSGTITATDTGAAAVIDAKLWDGTTVIASAEVQVNAASVRRSISLSGVLVSPVSSIRISARDVTNTTGVMTADSSGNLKDCTLTAIRIA